jgi:phage recombination protein Bet
MTTALAERAELGLTVTPDQLELVKRTVAADATPDELKLYLYDCARQGVHPLDKLVHFTKRQGKYTPITSIDFMRIRAAETGEYAGSDDAVFISGGDGPAPAVVASATVTVWRMVQGTRCPFTATARWSEYKPDAGASGRGDVMWRKMPHTMLAKCAEALALRKGFPRQLAGLYAKEEMDQADSPRGYVVEPPAPERPVLPPVSVRESGVGRAAESNGHSSEPDLAVDIPDGMVLITRINSGKPGGKVKAYLRHSGQAIAEEGLPIFREDIVALAEQLCQDRVPVVVNVKASGTSGKPYVVGLTRGTPLAKPDDFDEPVIDTPF